MSNPERPRVLLHTCCAPCSTVPLERLREQAELTLFFYGPNIHPAAEHERRLEEQRRLCRQLEVPLLEAPFRPEDWETAVGPWVHTPEGAERCGACFRLRMEATARHARQAGFEAFDVTLSVSRHKNSKRLAEIGRQVASEIGIRYLGEDFKKADGAGLSLRRSREYGLYRQDYCGCRLSLDEATERRERRRAPGR